MAFAGKVNPPDLPDHQFPLTPHIGSEGVICADVATSLVWMTTRRQPLNRKSTYNGIVSPRWIVVLLLSATCYGQEADAAPTGCPAGENSLPPSTRFEPENWIELSRTACLGACPSYVVRLYGDGRIVWNGERYVAVPGKVEGTIDASTVAALFEQAREKFWSLCAKYPPLGTDMSSQTVAINVAGTTTTVIGEGTEPEFLSEFAAAIDAGADTHRWHHGDPKVELFLGCPDTGFAPCDRLREDAFGPKHGVTPLMRAAARSDLGQVTALLQRGTDPNERDVSGWTALMYAADCASLEVVSALLGDGADATVRSNAGQLARDAVAGEGSIAKLNLLLAAGGNR